MFLRENETKQIADHTKTSSCYKLVQIHKGSKPFVTLESVATLLNRITH